MTTPTMSLTNTARAILGTLLLSLYLTAGETPEAEIKRAYKNLIDAENKHDLPTVKGMVWNSASALFVAEAPVGWHRFGGIDNVIGHLREMYPGPFHIDPIYEEGKVVFLTPDVAQTYAPVKITVTYAGQNPVPRPFIMVLVWVKTAQGRKMATDIPIPVPPDPAPR